MEESQNYPFELLGQALSYFNNNNPARQKFTNMFEPDFVGIPSSEQSSSHDLWAAICLAIHETLRLYPYEAREIFKRRHLGDRTVQSSKEEIAKDLGLPLRAVRKWLEQIEDDLEAELVYRELLPPKDEEEVA